MALSLTVLENLYLAASFRRGREGGRDGDLAEAERWLEFVGFEGKANAEAGPLGVFDKKRLMLATALATNPHVLLLDEPFGGLNPQEIDRAIGLIRQVRDGGMAVVVHRARDAGAHVACRPRAGDAPRRDVLRGNAAGDARRQAGDRGVPRCDAGKGRRTVSERAPTLDVRDLTAGYGQTIVVRDLSLTVPAGRCVVIIGPNGHGKTTLLRAVSGLLKPMAGEVVLDGERIDEAHAEWIACAGCPHPAGGRAVRRDDRRGEPPDGRVPQASWQGPPARRSSACTSCSPSCSTSATSTPGRSLAGSVGSWAFGRGLMREGGSC